MLEDNDTELNTTILLNPRERFSLGFDLDLSHSNIQDFGIGLGGGLGIRNIFQGAELVSENFDMLILHDKCRICYCWHFWSLFLFL